MDVTVTSVVRPHFQPPNEPSQARDDHLIDVYEWFGMLALRSPRLLATDTIDRYLSRYDAPECEPNESLPVSVVQLRWEGLLPSAWISTLWTTIL